MEIENPDPKPLSQPPILHSLTQVTPFVPDPNHLTMPPPQPPDPSTSGAHSLPVGDLPHLKDTNINIESNIGTRRGRIRSPRRIITGLNARKSGENEVNEATRAGLMN